MQAVRRERRGKAPARRGTAFTALRRELEAELDELAPGKRRVGEVALRDLGPRARRRALQILEVLKRMDSEFFGECVSCRRPIAYERLAVLPETRLCARCSWSRELAG